MDNEVKSVIPDNPLISVIIPVYNVEKYLRQCLDSVLAQTYDNYEIIIVDDGSTDQSPKICDEYTLKSNNIRVFHKSNGGASTARNVGLKESKGDYIFFLDSDDWIEPNTLETMMTTAKNENADLVFCEAQAIDDAKGTEIEGQYEYKEYYPTGDAYQIMKKMMERKEFHVAIWMLLLDKSIFIDNNLFFKEGIIYEDMIIAYQFFCLANHAAHVQKKLYTRRYHPNSVVTSAKTEKNYISAATVYREVGKFMKSLPDNKQSPKHIVRCAYKVLDDYRQMSAFIKRKYKNDYNSIIQDILDNDAYGDKALKMDCKSHLLWGIYKLKEKLIK